jgi:hypothetical protein
VLFIRNLFKYENVRGDWTILDVKCPSLDDKLLATLRAPIVNVDHSKRVYCWTPMLLFVSS